MIPPVEELKKDTLGATYEHINRLIKEKDFDIQEYVKYNEKLSVFEKKVQAIIIDTFKLKEGVINCLLSEDPHLVRRMLKCEWFFQDALPPKSWEDDIFPNVSFSTRCKIINQLSRNVKSEKDAEELFQFIDKNYGSKYSEMFLARCSSEFVSDYITKCKPTFSHHDSEKNLINICKRFPDIVIPFFQNEMCKDGSRGSKVIRFLAKNHPLSVTPILEEHYTDLYFFRFGKKSSKVLHSEFMKLAEKTPLLILKERMNISVVFKRLSYEEKIAFLKLLVEQNIRGSDYPTLKDWPQSSTQMKDFLELMPPNERAGMVETVFSQLFNENYLDHPEMWSFQFMELFPEEYRSRLVKELGKRSEDKAVRDVLLSECEDQEREPSETFIYLLGFKDAFPSLTEIMAQMSTVARREIVLKEMVHNCVINKDADALESVVKYISIRHKNENPRVISNLLLYKFMPSLKIINLNVWDWMEKMATLLMVKLSDAHVFGVVMESYIGYRIRNNLDAQPQVKSVLKLSVVPYPNSFVLVRKMEKSYSKALIMLYYQEIFSGDHEYAVEQVKDKLLLSLLMSINDYNDRRKRTRINMEDLPLLVEGIDEMIKKVRDWTAKYSLASAVMKNRFLKNKYANFLLDMSMKPKTLRYLIKSHPDCVIENVDRILTYILEFNENRQVEKIFAFGCQMDFLGYLPKLLSVIGDRFNNSRPSSIKVRALKAYSYIANLEDFIELTKQYVPQEDQLAFDGNKTDFYDIQVNVPGLVKNVKPVWKTFDFVSKYLKKDLLRWVLPSLFAICHNTSVKTIIPILEQQLSKKLDISVKKVIVFSILDLQTKAERLFFCRMLWEQQKRTALREIVFHGISRSWREDQTDEIFELMKKCIWEADEEAIKGRLKINLAPPQYVGEYARVLWKFMEKYHGKSLAVTCRREIVNHFNEENISDLSEELCQKILKMYLLEPRSEIQVEKFCIDYILYHSQPVEQKLSFVLDILVGKEAKPQSVRHFVNRVKNLVRSNPGAIFLVFEGLLKEWPKIYDVSKMFKEYLLLNYMRAYCSALKASNSKKKIFAAAMGREFRKIVNGVPNYQYFIDVFKSTFFEFSSDLRLHDIMELVMDSFLGSSFGHVEGIIAIHMIPSDVLDILYLSDDDPEVKNSYLIDHREKYKTVFKKLMDKNDNVMKIYMNLRTCNAVD